MKTPQRLILLVNIGSPLSARVEDVRHYLTTFLSDRHIISVPWLLRECLVRSVIVPRRASRSAARYARMVEQCGGAMPLTESMLHLEKEVEHLTGIPTLYAPRYSDLSRRQWGKKIAKKIGTAEDSEVLLLPMYPHYSRSNAGSALEYFSNLPKPGKGHFSTDVLRPWYDFSSYIDLLADQISSQCDTTDERYHFIATYHSIPLQHQQYDRIQGWNYAEQCHTTLRLAMQRLSIPDSRYHLAYHSAMGHQEWLSPSLTDQLQMLLHRGIRHVVVFSPGFIYDCLETIIDIDAEARTIFLNEGGISFIYIPCVGSDPRFPTIIPQLIAERMDK